MIQNTQLEILASFFPDLGQKTAKEIESATKLSHEPTFRALKALTKAGLIKERKIGKTNVYDPLKTDLTFLAYTYFMTNRIKTFKDKHPLLAKRIKEYIQLTDPRCAILFGSLAKGSQTATSDIDILIVTNKKDAETVARTFKTKYNLRINPVIVKPGDFKNIKKDNPTFHKDLIQYGIALDGMESLYKEAYDGQMDV